MHSTTKAISPPQECTGCALCANVCVHDAIDMVWNSRGFLVPQVNIERCANCGACVRNCPAQPVHLAKIRSWGDIGEIPIAYGGWNSNKKEQLNSSSGGILSALAEYIFEQKGCVFGVVWLNKDTAAYAKAENMTEMLAMQGSKYTQAIPGVVYRQVKAELKKGRQVLFCGTSCQVYALKIYLKQKYKNLLLIDILCHGTPSRLLLQSYISEYEKQNKKEIERIQFRDKAGNWQQYHVKKIFIDGTNVTDCNREDAFMRIFTGDFALNIACYSCPHAKFPRVGDISLGDFWGDLQTLHPDWPIPDGIGSVLGNTPNGVSILRKLQTNGNITLHNVPFTELYKGQPLTYQRNQVSPPLQREDILTLLKIKPISTAYHYLFDYVQCGPIKLYKNGYLHRAYILFRNLKRKLWRKKS